MTRLNDKVAVVMGAGAGIGRAIASLFAAEGAHVFVTDVNGESAAETAAGVSAASSRRRVMTVDVSRGQDVSALFREVDSNT